MGRNPSFGEDDRRIERTYVAVPDVAEDATCLRPGQCPGEASRRLRQRQGVALFEIFGGEERVEAGAGAAHDNVLISHRQDLGLVEVARAEKGAQCFALAHIVEGVGEQFLPVVRPGVGNFPPFQVGAVA